jgi:hypothetical protein
MEFFINASKRLHTIYRDNGGVSESFLFGEWATVKTDSRWLERQVKFGAVKSIPDPRAAIEGSEVLDVTAITSKDIREQLVAGTPATIPVASLDKWSLGGDDDPNAVWVVQFATIGQTAGKNTAFGVMAYSFTKEIAARKKYQEVIEEAAAGLVKSATHDVLASDRNNLGVHAAISADVAAWEKDTIAREAREKKEREELEAKRAEEARIATLKAEEERVMREAREAREKYEAEKSELDALLKKKPSELTNEEFAKRTRLKRQLRATEMEQV